MGEIVRYKRDVWGEEVILGVSWDLLWVVAVAVLVLLAAHAIIMAALANKKIEKASSEVDEYFVMRPLIDCFIG